MSSLDSCQENLKKLGIRLYQGSEQEDRALAVLWDSLVESGEIDLLVAQSARSLSTFLGLFRLPNMLIYTWDGIDMESIHWVEPVTTSANAVFFSSWCSPETRGTKRHLELATAIYELIFAMGKKLILGVTKQEQLLALHVKLGYAIMDPMPFLFDDCHAYIMYMTQPMFEDSRIYAVRNKLRNKTNANQQPANA